jgi:hypothetical protein
VLARRPDYPAARVQVLHRTHPHEAPQHPTRSHRLVVPGLLLSFKVNFDLRLIQYTKAMRIDIDSDVPAVAIDRFDWIGRQFAVALFANIENAGPFWRWKIPAVWRDLHHRLLVRE